MLFYFGAQGYSSGRGLHWTGYWEPPTLWQADDCAIFVFIQYSQTRFICTDYNAVLNMFSNVIIFHLYCSYTSEKQYCGSTACLYRSWSGFDFPIWIWSRSGSGLYPETRPSCLERILSFLIYKQDFWSILKLFKGNLYESTNIVEIFKNIPDFSVKKVRWGLGSRSGFAGSKYGSRYGPESGKIMRIRIHNTAEKYPTLKVFLFNTHL